MQDRAVTWAFSIADISLLGPLVSLTVDTHMFCQPIWRSKLLLLLVVLYNAAAYIALVASPNHPHLNVLQLSNDIPQTFRWESLGIVIGGVFAYAAVVNGLRRFLLQFEKHAIHPS